MSSLSARATRCSSLRRWAQLGQRIGLGAWLLLGCVGAPRPRVISQADHVSESPAVQRAAALAPQVHAQAEKLRRDAEQAYEAGKLARAQVLAERAIAVFNRAVVLSRVSVAEQRLKRAELALGEVRAELAKLDDQQARLASEADGLELRVKVLKDREPLGELKEAGPERDKARGRAAKALRSEARLLCLAARMVEPKRPAVAEALQQLEAAAGAKSGTEQLEEATAQRAKCLKELTLARRPQRAASGTAQSDALLKELTQAGGLFAFRDDRGVVVVLRDALDQGGVSDDAKARVALLGKVAKAHPAFPVMVVAHSAGGKDDGEAAATALATALEQAGAPSVSRTAVGDTLPVAHPARPGARQRNTRLEIVFVSPVP